MFKFFAMNKNAGSSMCTVVVPDMDRARTTLEEAGIALSDERKGDFGKVAHLTDPDGNPLIVAEPPPAGHQRER